MLLFLLLSQSNSANISEDTDRHSKYQGVNYLDYYSCSREKYWLTKRWGEAGRLSLVKGRITQKSSVKAIYLMHKNGVVEVFLYHHVAGDVLSTTTRIAPMI